MGRLDAAAVGVLVIPPLAHLVAAPESDPGVQRPPLPEWKEKRVDLKLKAKVVLARVAVEGTGADAAEFRWGDCGGREAEVSAQKYQRRKPDADINPDGVGRQVERLVIVGAVEGPCQTDAHRPLEAGTRRRLLTSRSHREKKQKREARERPQALRRRSHVHLPLPLRHRSRPSREKEPASVHIPKGIPDAPIEART